MICVDTQIMIWGIKKENTAGQDEMIPKTQSLLHYIKETKQTVIVPSPVVAECLVQVPLDKKREFLEIINKSFLVQPFDLSAAYYYSKMWQEQKDMGEIKKMQENGLTRQILKADCMIVAIAVSRKAEHIYSHDRGLKNFAKDYISVKSVTDIPDKYKQTKLNLEELSQKSSSFN